MKNAIENLETNETDYLVHIRFGADFPSLPPDAVPFPGYVSANIPVRAYSPLEAWTVALDELGALNDGNLCILAFAVSPDTKAQAE